MQSARIVILLLAIQFYFSDRPLPEVPYNDCYQNQDIIHLIHYASVFTILLLFRDSILKLEFTLI